MNECLLMEMLVVISCLWIWRRCFKFLFVIFWIVCFYSLFNFLFLNIWYFRKVLGEGLVFVSFLILFREVCCIVVYVFFNFCLDNDVVVFIFKVGFFLFFMYICSVCFFEVDFGELVWFSLFISGCCFFEIEILEDDVVIMWFGVIFMLKLEGGSDWFGVNCRSVVVSYVVGFVDMCNCFFDFERILSVFWSLWCFFWIVVKWEILVNKNWDVDKIIISVVYEMKW